VALIYERSFANSVAELDPEFPGLETYVVLEDENPADHPALGVAYEDALAGQSAERDFAPRSGDDIYLVYTGGTTGLPKGVLWRHEDWYFNMAHFLSPAVERPEDIAELADNPLRMRSLTLSPLMHGGGQFPLMLTLFNGGVGLFPVSRHFDPHEILEIVERHRASTVSIIGDAMGRPLAEAQLDPDRKHDCSSLLAISTGGALLTDPVRHLLREAFGKIYITGGIGSSEIGSAARETRSDEALDGPRFRLNENVAVLDEDLRPISPGSPDIGRIARKGYIPLGYYKDEQKTRETFVTDAEGTRWVIPGDFARVEADGSFCLLGRGSSCINTGGEKVFPDEVESVVVRHPRVRNAAVVGIPDPDWMQRIVALVELQDESASLDLEDLQAHCRRHLAGYKIPRALVITELVRTPAGKVDQVWACAFAEAQA
ncbi:MAG: AMP-binding protein, partial [Deltaproteobacteria bacterium]|nr:AMP-binding protein [Deltaproteobacteria bacterium]